MHVQEQSPEPAGDLQWTKGMCVGHRPGHTDQGPQAALPTGANSIRGDPGSRLCIH